MRFPSSAFFLCFVNCFDCTILPQLCFCDFTCSQRKKKGKIKKKKKRSRERVFFTSLSRRSKRKRKKVNKISKGNKKRLFFSSARGTNQLFHLSPLDTIERRSQP